MPFHRAGADEQLGADLRVGVARDGEPGDVRLLGRKRGGRLDRALAHRLAGGRQLVPRAFGECLHAHRGQHVVSGPQLLTGVCAAVLAAQPLAVEQVRAGELGPQLGAAEPADRLPVQTLGRLALAQQRTGTRLDAQPEVGSAGLSDVRKPFERPGGEARVPGASGGLDQLGQRPRGDMRVHVLGGVSGCRECVGVAAQAVVEDRGHPMRPRQRDPLAAGRGVLDSGLDQRGGLGFPAPQRSQQQGGVGRDARPGRLADRIVLSDQRSGGREVTTPCDGKGHLGQQDRELIQSADVTGELNLPQQDHAPAVVVPQGNGSLLGHPAPPEQLFHGDVRVGEGDRGLPQSRRRGV